MTRHSDIDRVLFDEDQIRAAVDRVARQLSRSFAGKDLTIVAVLKGSCVFAADLIRRLPMPLELTFVAAASYRDATEPGDLAIQFLPAVDEIRGRDVLLVDDILDTGRTLHRLRREIEEKGAREVRTCVFLDKPSRRTAPLQADFSCFRIDDVFVVGYGLDFAGRYRNLPYVATLREGIVIRRPAAGTEA